jgi:hypothetical protein
MLRGGGRNGVALSFGFRWAIGKDSNKQNQKVQSNPSKKSATLSQKLDFTQKLSMNKSQTSITPHKAVIKHLSKI